MAPVHRRGRWRRGGSLLIESRGPRHPSVRRASLWTDSVFHVLAHVDARGLPATCHNSAYVSWAEERLGPADARSLGEDVRTIAKLATTHDTLARMQALAWVFESVEQCTRACADDLATLSGVSANARALAIAIDAGPVSEVLRAAAELELTRLAELDEVAVDLDTIRAALERASSAAPLLVEHEVSVAPALGLRGRVLARSIVVGVPGIGCPDAEHVAWQAAHEATVSEVSSNAGGSFADIERKAIGLLRSRARRAGLGDAHGRWLARLDLRALGAIADVDDPPE